LKNNEGGISLTYTCRWMSSFAMLHSIKSFIANVTSMLF